MLQIKSLASDITYVATLEGWLYLAVILDLFSRRVVGWKLGETLKAELVVTALRNALVLRLRAQGRSLPEQAQSEKSVFSAEHTIMRARTKEPKFLAQVTEPKVFVNASKKLKARFRR